MTACAVTWTEDLLLSGSARAGNRKTVPHKRFTLGHLCGIAERMSGVRGTLTKKIFRCLDDGAGWKVRMIFIGELRVGDSVT